MHMVQPTLHEVQLPPQATDRLPFHCLLYASPMDIIGMKTSIIAQNPLLKHCSAYNFAFWPIFKALKHYAILNFAIWIVYVCAIQIYATW